jgi:DNA-binding NtrC family response regulator
VSTLNLIGDFLFLAKPFSMDQLRSLLEHALSHTALAAFRTE